MTPYSAAVRAAMDVVGRPLDLSERHMVDALARAGWLRDPAEAEALWAVVAVAQEARSLPRLPGSIFARLIDALDALPPVDSPESTR